MGITDREDTQPFVFYQIYYSSFMLESNRASEWSSRSIEFYDSNPEIINLTVTITMSGAQWDFPLEICWNSNFFHADLFLFSIKKKSLSYIFKCIFFNLIRLWIYESILINEILHCFITKIFCNQYYNKTLIIKFINGLVFTLPYYCAKHAF